MGKAKGNDKSVVSGSISSVCVQLFQGAQVHGVLTVDTLTLQAVIRLTDHDTQHQIAEQWNQLREEFISCVPSFTF